MRRLLLLRKCLLKTGAKKCLPLILNLSIKMTAEISLEKRAHLLQVFICRSSLEKCRPFSHSRKIGQKNKKPADIRVPLLPALALLSFPSLLSTFLFFSSYQLGRSSPSHRASSAYASSSGCLSSPGSLRPLVPLVLRFSWLSSWFSPLPGSGSRHSVRSGFSGSHQHTSAFGSLTTFVWFYHSLLSALCWLSFVHLVGHQPFTTVCSFPSFPFAPFLPVRHFGQHHNSPVGSCSSPSIPPVIHFASVHSVQSLPFVQSHFPSSLATVTIARFSRHGRPSKLAQPSASV